MTPIHTLLSELDALEDKATPGEWYCAADENDDEAQHLFADNEWVGNLATPDAAYLAALANAYPLLRAEILRLREALEPFALGADDWDDNYTDGCAVDRFRLGKQTVGDLRRARDALKGSEGEMEGGGE